MTTVERTILDLAERSDGAALGITIDSALRRRLTNPKRLVLAERRHAGQGRRLLLPLRQALADRGLSYDPGANDWELEMDRLWERLGLPAAERQYRIRIGNRTYRPDRAIVDLKIAVDWNGFDAHGTRTGFDNDSNRRSRLAAAGWYPLDFTSRSSPNQICETVLAICEERRRLSLAP